LSVLGQHPGGGVPAAGEPAKAGATSRPLSTHGAGLWRLADFSSNQLKNQ